MRSASPSGSTRGSRTLSVIVIFSVTIAMRGDCERFFFRTTAARRTPNPPAGPAGGDDEQVVGRAQRV